MFEFFKAKLEERRLRKERLIEEAKAFFDEWWIQNSKLSIYIKVGYQEPTILVSASTIFGESISISTFNMGIVPASKIVEVLKDFQEIHKLPNPLRFVLAPEESNFKEYLQKNGIDNVDIATKEEWEDVMWEDAVMSK